MDRRDLADQLVLASIRLVRRLRALDPRPALTRAESSALAVLCQAGESSLGELATHEGVKPPSMTRTVQQLESKGLVRRRQDRIDARAIRLSATAKGRKSFEAGHQRVLEPLVARIGALGEADLRALEAALPVIVRLGSGG